MSASKPRDTREMPPGNLDRLNLEIPSDVSEGYSQPGSLGAAYVKHGRAKPADPDSEKDRLAAAGMQAFLDGQESNPLVAVLRAMQTAGYSDHDGIPIALLIERFERQAAPPKCEVAWALTEWAIGWVGSLFTDKLSDAVDAADFKLALRIAAVAKELSAFLDEVHRLKPDGARNISGNRLHRLLAEAGWHCPDLDLSQPYDEAAELAVEEMEGSLSKLVAMLGRMISDKPA